MTLLRMENVAIMVDDLDQAIAFFAEVGLELENHMPVEGEWAGRVVGLENMRVEIAMMRTPDGNSRLELTTFHQPHANASQPNVPVNTIGLHRVMFGVSDIDDAVARLQKHGAELVGDIAQYEDAYRLCYLRGPSGIIVALAEKLTE